MNNRRRMLLCAALAAVPGMYMSGLRAQGYPKKSLTLVVPFAPGGNIDVVARTLSVPLSKALGQTVVVDNRAGAGGGIGTAQVARAEADGYTLLIATPSQIATLPQMFSAPYDMQSFAPIGLATRTSMILVARADDARLKSFDDFLSLARSKPAAINAGHAGNGTPNHLALLQLEQASRSTFSSIAYKGSGPALVNLLGGQIDVVFDQVTSSMPYIKAGNFRALAVLGPRADPSLPGVPTLAELGLTPFDATTYAGLLAPAATTPDVIARLSQALNAALEDPHLIATLSNLGSYTARGDAAAFKALLDTEHTLSRTMVASGKLTTQ